MTPSKPAAQLRDWGLLLLFLMLAGGCTLTPNTLAIRNNPTRLMENTIYKTDDGTVVTPAQLFAELGPERVIYVGESHTNPAHHAIQLQVIQALARQTPDLIIGMEMFDVTYQPVLDRWCAGQLDVPTFLKQTHWAVNWRYDFALYRDILEFAKENRLRVVALNIPFHIPAKIRIGGINSLTEADRRYLPQTIDTGNTAHRNYLKTIYDLHAFAAEDHFATFYEAQCAWEDAMADAVAQHLGEGRMVVLVGNGHIIRKFGIPDRAFSRTHAPFKTIYLAEVGGEAERDWADYLWITAETPMRHMPMRRPAP
ncbi:hypothetical protein JCM12296A_07040 [Desulfosarcina cetonica]